MKSLHQVLLLAALAAMIFATIPVGAAPPPPIAGPKNPSFEQNFAYWTAPFPPPTDATSTIRAWPGKTRRRHEDTPASLRATPGSRRP